MLQVDSSRVMLSRFMEFVITYLFFLLTLRLSCLPSGQPVRAYPSPTYLVGLSTIANYNYGVGYYYYYPIQRRGINTSFGPRAPFLFIFITLITYLSADHVTFDLWCLIVCLALALGLRVYFSPLFLDLDPVSLSLLIVDGLSTLSRVTWQCNM